MTDGARDGVGAGEGAGLGVDEARAGLIAVEAAG